MNKLFFLSYFMLFAITTHAMEKSAKEFSIDNATEFKIKLCSFGNKTILLRPKESAVFKNDGKMSMIISNEPVESDSQSARQFYYREHIDEFEIPSSGKYILEGEEIHKVNIKHQKQQIEQR